MGLFALRQDRLLARMEAEEQANRWLNELVHAALPQELQTGLDELAKVSATEFAWRNPLDPQTDGLARLQSLLNAGQNVELLGAACLVGSQENLVYPPVPSGMPPPEPLDLSLLDLLQQDAWFACEEMWAAATPDTNRVRTLLATDVPKRFAAIARYWTALLLLKSDVPTALEEMRLLSESDVDLRSESGIQLRDLAALNFLRFSGPRASAERSRLARVLCARLVASPSPLGDAMWEQLPSEPREVIQSWDLVRRLHAKAREFYRSMQESGGQPGLLSWQGKDYWVVEQKTKGGRWLVALSMDGLVRAFEQMQRGSVAPQYLGVSAELAGRSLLSRTPEQPVLAEAPAKFAGLPVKLAIYLTDPAAFDAKRAERARWTVALIAVALAAVLAGFFAAWTAFRRQQQLSEMKTNFVSSVSHELRAPIASVQLMAEELLEGERPSDEKLEKYHRFIGQECRRLSGVIENVLDFARREQGRERFEFEPTDVSNLVTQTVEILRPYAAERGVRIAQVCQGNPRDVTADGHALQRVLVNLLDNAIKHSARDREVVVGLEFDGPRVVLWVEDEGPGIPREEQQRIFERFYRIGSELQRQTQGVGLGLSIVKHLVEVHGGTVTVHSAVGEGSQFVVELPADATAVTKPQNVSSV
jgi:signal transduction histidine kinase